MARNIYPFEKIAKCRYGRKVAYVNYSEVTEDNVLDILGKDNRYL